MLFNSFSKLRSSNPVSESRRLCFSSSARSSRSSLLFSGEDIDGELTMRTCDFLQLNIWKKMKKKNNSSTSVDRESRRHTDRNHAVASGFVYNRCTLAGTHAPYFEVGVCLAPYLRDTVNDDELPPIARHSTSFGISLE